jgi:hypothetical protein
LLRDILMNDQRRRAQEFMVENVVTVAPRSTRGGATDLSK